MNILFNCEEYPPMPSGGIGSVVKNVAEGLAKRGHNIVVAGYYWYEPTCNTHTVVNGVHIYYYSLGRRASTFRRYIYEGFNKLHLAGPWIQYELDYYENKLASLIEQHDIDVMEMTDFYNFNYCRSMLRFHKFDIPVVMRFHGSVYYLSENFGKGRLEVKFNDLNHFARANYYSYVSSYIRNFVKTMGGEYCSNKEVVIHNMVEDDFLYRNTSQVDAKTILYFGKLTKTKGAFATVKAFNIFHKTHPDWKLVMAGPAYSDELLDDVQYEVRKNIEFPGLCNREQIKRFIDSCSFVCIPSFFETFGMAPLEAMARSKAVIFTSRTSGPEIIEDGKNGLLVDPDNISMIAQKMSFLADNVETLNEIGANAYKTIDEELSESHVLDILESYYKALK